MPTAITNDIRITVETAYQNNRNFNVNGEHMFAYRITIQNDGEYTIKLLRRHWFITDINFENGTTKKYGYSSNNILELQFNISLLYTLV